MPNPQVRPGVYVAFLVVFGLAILMASAFGRDLGQWENVTPEISAWYRALRQPDNPTASCCGEADSYYCDEHAKGAQVYCIINDDRDNQKLRRTPVANGTAINIPDTKINRDPNLEGRAVVFLSSGGFVYCFVGSSGS